ncbi:hypothetical protein [Devosia rhizoryzae]|uniref:Uncharacterized protein n=1 Tax=Devosia rhizoryzae TaxID=2774137 RepID=A0ABX7C6N7_9HYPH|nr:hypothetical protein [Devosia rhizoryzae]QQR38397.1 hypothetical protein JI748_11470 [Devosia rhizoryzae]
MLRQRISRLQLAAIYLRALRNEIEVDIDGYKAVGARPEDFGFLPRLSGIWPRLKGAPRLSSSGARLLRGIWKLGLFIPFFIRQYLSLVRNAASSEPAAAGPSIHILLSALAPQLIANAQGTTATAFTVPWQRYPNGVPHSYRITIGDVLTRRDLLNCLLDAIAIARRIADRKGMFADWHLQTYTLFRWICVARALEKIQCNRMVMANHYDRWAILIDRLARQTGRSVAIAQHGIEAWRRLPTKLRSVDTLHVYNRQEAALFKQFILSPEAVEAVEVFFLDNSIRLAGAKAGNGPTRVVIVGHPEHDVNQLRFLHAARKARPDVQFIYKPHPTARSVNADIEAVTLVWDEPGVFPRCEFVFSYQSTLGLQYRDAGIPTFIHDRDMSDSQVNVAVGSIPEAVQPLRPTNA